MNERGSVTKLGDEDGRISPEEVGTKTATDVLEDDLTIEDTIELYDHPTVTAVLDDVRAYFAEQSDAIVGAPSDEFIASKFFDFGYLEQYEEVSWKWVNEPYAYVTILYDERENEHHYRVVEPMLDDFEGYVRRDLVELLRNNLMYRDFDEHDRESAFRREARELVDEQAATVHSGTTHKVLYYLIRDFIDYGPIDPLMRDDAIEDISCDGDDVPVFVYHRSFRDLRTNVRFDEQRLDAFTFRLAQRAGKQMTISNPLVDATLPNGSRIQLTLGGDVSSRGSNFTVRKFSEIPFTPVELIRWNTFSVEQMAYFWLAIENNRSLVFAGGTGSGKTSSLNAASFFIPPSSKVVTIEDTREIDLPHENWIQSVTRGAITSEGRGEVSMYQLLQAALRQRPEYLLVGEIRTEERVALSFFQAMSTGHTSYTTLHADSVDTVLSRLQNPPLNVPTQMVQELDVVSVQQQTFFDEQRVRRNRTITELYPDPDDPNGVKTHEVFRRDAERDVHEMVADSLLLSEIAADRGWSDTEMSREFERRQRVLQYLLDEDITEYAPVSKALRRYARDAERVLEAIEDGTMTQADLDGTQMQLDAISPETLQVTDIVEEL